MNKIIVDAVTLLRFHFRVRFCSPFDHVIILFFISTKLSIEIRCIEKKINEKMIFCLLSIEVSFAKKNKEFGVYIIIYFSSGENSSDII